MSKLGHVRVGVGANYGDSNPKKKSPSGLVIWVKSLSEV
jgi:hypothetical protein